MQEASVGIRSLNPGSLSAVFLRALSRRRTCQGSRLSKALQTVRALEVPAERSSRRYHDRVIVAAVLPHRTDTEDKRGKSQSKRRFYGDTRFRLPYLGTRLEDGNTLAGATSLPSS